SSTGTHKGSILSTMDTGLESLAPSEAGSDEEEESESRRSWSHNTTSLAGTAAAVREKLAERNQGAKSKCSCGQYIHTAQVVGKKEKQGKSAQGDVVAPPGGEGEAELRNKLSALGEYDLLHTFVAFMSGGLNLAKAVLRLHFSIDPAAYQQLPEPACQKWEDALMPWYREFHRMDMHNRSRHGMLMTSVLRGMLGDGLTSGLHDEALDVLRLPLPAQAPATESKLQPREAGSLAPQAAR
ncbi:unnamed protein product, partial [Effrenium voratum]